MDEEIKKLIRRIEEKVRVRRRRKRKKGKGGRIECKKNIYTKLCRGMREREREEGKEGGRKGGKERGERERGGGEGVREGGESDKGIHYPISLFYDNFFYFGFLV